MKWKPVPILFLFLVFIAEYGAGQESVSVKTLLQNEFPKLNLLSFAEGNFTGSGDREYLAFFEDPRQRYEKDSPKVIWRVVVFLVKNEVVTKRYDLHSLGLYSLDYGKRELSVIKDPHLSFGRWAGYAYIGDYNENGLEEILFFELTGMSFLPTIVEFKGKEFVNVLDFSTAKNGLSEIRTVTRDGHKFLKLYGYGSDYTPKGKRDWYLYQWNRKTDRYEVVDEGLE